jgi:CRISPR-associated protein Csh2
MSEPLQARQEFFFAYDIRMGNPNGDPDENRPRVLPDGTYYVTDVRLKRFIRDFFKSQGKTILVDKIEDKTTNLTGRVGHFLAEKGIKKATAQEARDILLDSFIDARLFGSSFAFKKQNTSDKTVKTEVEVKGKKEQVEWEPIKTLTGAVQVSHGEVLHKAQEVEIRGTSIFASDQENSQGTFTEFFGLRYGLVGFNGIANEHTAVFSRLSTADYQDLLKAMWLGVRSAANTRSKTGQVPRLLVNVSYKPSHEFQFGNLLDYVKLTGEGDERNWSNPQDYTLDLSLLRQRLTDFSHHIGKVSYCLSPDVRLSPEDKAFLNDKENLNFDGTSS